MIRSLRHRRLFLLRLLMLVVVALGTAGGALASALGDLHELSHADHPAVPHGDAEAETGHDDDDTSARLMHALVHCGHCHGQGGVLPFAHAGWELIAAPARVTHGPLDASWRPAPQDSPLRPPIQA